MIHLFLKQWQPVFAVAIIFLMWAWESIAPFFAVRHRYRHAVRNLTISGVNAIVLALAFANATVGVSIMAQANGFGILNWLRVSEPWNGVLAFLALDFWTYWWHRFNHTVPFLWRFHRMHHSDPEMDVTTATRFHLGEITISSLIRLALVPLVGVPIWTLIVYDVVLLASTQFHHANISLPSAIDRAIRYVIVSPFMHKVHHSRIQRETDSNFTSIFSIWDRLFGSYVEVQDYHAIVFGVDSFEGDEYQSLPGLLKTPLVSPSHDNLTVAS